MNGHEAIALGVITAIVAVFGLSFTVFWSIIKNVEGRLSDKIDSFGNVMSKCQEHRVKVLTEHDEKFATLTKYQSMKADIKTCEENYVRKREHELEFALLKEKMDSMQLSIKELKMAVENGNTKRT